MNEMSTNHICISSMSDMEIEKVRAFESIALSMPQTDINTSHLLHAGMYARTILIPVGTVITGALIKIATILIIQGDIIAYIGDESVHLKGYNILPACANRKQAFYAKEDTYLTMLFSCDAKTIKEAEDMFTDEADMLLSRIDDTSNQIMITGE